MERFDQLIADFLEEGASPKELVESISSQGDHRERLLDLAGIDGLLRDHFTFGERESETLRRASLWLVDRDLEEKTPAEVMNRIGSFKPCLPGKAPFIRTSTKILFLSLAVAAVLGIVALYPRENRPNPSSENEASARFRNEIRSQLDVIVNSTLQSDRRKVMASMNRLADHGEKGLDEVRRALREDLAKLGLTPEQAVARLSARYRDSASPNGEYVSYASGLFPPHLKDDPLARARILQRVEQTLHLEACLRKKEPLLKDPQLAIRSFEWLAAHGHWETAASCLSSGSVPEALELYQRIAAIRKSAREELSWEDFRFGPYLRILLTSSNYVTSRRDRISGDFAFSHTFAIAKYVQKPDRFLIEDVVEGNRLQAVVK